MPHAIEMSRRLLKRIRVVFAKALNLTSPSRAPAVTFQSSENHTYVQIVGTDAAVRYRLEGRNDFTPFAVPFEFLKRCEGTKDQPLSLSLEPDAVVASWEDGGIPQTERCAGGDPVEFPALPEDFTSNPPGLLTALREAVNTTDRFSSRYALNCLRLRGAGGQIAATDSYQLFAQSGFDFPWDEDLLMPASRALACPDFDTNDAVEIGKTDDWVAIQSGPWTIQLRLEQDRRFPDLDRQLEFATHETTLHLNDADADFLANSVKRLPAAKQHNSPVTVDLNGTVAVRAKGEDERDITELVLNGSSRTGEAVRFVTNRNFLARAAKLGFREVEIEDVNSPVRCRDDNRTYVWALLGEADALKPGENVTRIDSPVDPNHTHAAHNSSPAPVKRRTTPRMPTANRTSKQEATGDESTELLDAAETLKSSLRDALSKTTNLIAGLKRQRTQTKRIRSAVASLKQLETLEV